MTDVFISYERGSERKAEQVASLLKEAGFEVWLDADLPTHRAYTDVIREELEAARAVLVLWTSEAGQSEWVRAEADLARERRKLVQATLDGSLPPLPFNQIHSSDLSNWRGDARDPHWLKVVQGVAALSGASASAPTIPVPSRRPFWAKPRAGRWAWGAAVAAVLLAAGSGVWIALHNLHPKASAPTAVAVMPFQVESAAPEARFFADSLTDTIQGALSSNQIQVISKAHAGALIGPGADAAAARLGVRLILNGSAAADGKTLDVSVHVDDAVEHLTLWSGHFRGAAEHPDEVKASMAAATVAVLKCSAEAVAPHGLADRQVLMLFLRACDLYEHAYAEAQAREQLFDVLRQVTLRAPRFAPGLAMRAEALTSLAGYFRPDEAAALRTEALDYANRALAIDPTNARANFALVFLLQPTDSQRQEAMMRRALNADPNSPWSNGGLGEIMAYVGRMQEAADLVRKANAANPLALDWSAESPRMSALAGRTQEASDGAAEVANAWPDDAGARLARFEIASIQSDWDEAFALLDTGRVQMSAPLIAAERSCLTAYKTPTPALRAKARADALGVTAQPGGLKVAVICLARMGFVDDAFNLAQSYHPGGSSGLENGQLFGPETANLRRDPRFVQLAERVGLTRYWRATGKWPDFCAEPGLPYDCKAEAARLAKGRG